MQKAHSELLNTAELEEKLQKFVKRRTTESTEYRLEADFIELEEVLLEYKATKDQFEALKLNTKDFFDLKQSDALTGVRTNLRNTVMDVKNENEKSNEHLKNLKQENQKLSELYRYATGAMLCKTDGIESTFSLKALNSPKNCVKTFENANPSVHAKAWQVVHETQIPPSYLT